MVNDAPSVRSLFEQALELASAAERAAFLDDACSGNPELRSSVESLLRAHADAGSFLATPVVDAQLTTAMRPIAEQPGTVIGPYKLLQQIGEGGMGVVFMAEQTEPLQRTVALKIIKPGMDTRQVIARFEAERQAVAMMDHPNIAKVLDAGTTASERPYFVMELVKGVPITTYCDDKHLPLRERLGLFIQVCQAVQHAHQKGVIHRDIKPTNVLVAEYDHHVVPKVIDFGVAKATGQRLTERTMFTEFGQVLGTLEYMSPEQAKLNQLDVDTRSDVYSLGVLLYELLAGSTPFERKRLQDAAFDEMLRIIREEEPPKPSTRLSSSDALPSIAVNRGVEPLMLNRSVEGELDWIVMKALEKDRNRRYDAANGIAADVQRHLNDEAVEARPTTRVYRMTKFVRRNKVAVLASSAVATAIILGLVLAIAGFIQARRQAEIARAETVRATRTFKFLQEMLTSINPDANRGADVTVPQVLNRAADSIDSTFADQPEVRINLHEVIGQAYYGLVRYKQAMPHLQRAVDLRERYLPEEKLALADALLRLAQVYSWDSNKHDLALAKSRDALTIYKTRVPASDERVIIANSLEAHFATPTLDARSISPDLWAARVLPTVLGLTQDQIARLPRMWGRAIAEAQELNRAGDIPGARMALDKGHAELLAELRNLSSAGRVDAARQLIRQAYSPWMEMPLLRSIMPNVLISEAWELRRDDKNLSAAEAILREAAAAGREVWGQDHPYIARALTDLAIVLQQQGKPVEAERSAREALAMRRKLLGMEDPETIISAELLIDVLTKANKQSEADSLRGEFDVPDAAPIPKQATK